MGTRTFLFGTSAVVIATWMAPRPASACSFITACAETPTLALVGDVASRPLNACIGVRYAEVDWYREPVVPPELAYVASDGTRIALEATDVLRVYCPTQPLAPDTDYALVGPERDTSDYDCTPLAEIELLTFHTGTNADTTAPSAPGTVEDESCRRDVCDSSACCGPYDVIEHQSTWGVATDDGGEVAYAVDGELRTWTTRRWTNGGGGRGSVWVFDREPREVRAIDVAGNLSEAALHGEPCVPEPLDPDGGVPDAFTPSAPDASIATSVDASMPSGGGSGGGCSIASSAPRTWLPFGLVFLLVVGCRRRRTTA